MLSENQTNSLRDDLQRHLLTLSESDRARFWKRYNQASEKDRWLLFEASREELQAYRLLSHNGSPPGVPYMADSDIESIKEAVRIRLAGDWRSLNCNKYRDWDIFAKAPDFVKSENGYSRGDHFYPAKREFNGKKWEFDPAFAAYREAV